MAQLKIGGGIISIFVEFLEFVNRSIEMITGIAVLDTGAISNYYPY